MGVPRMKAEEIEVVKGYCKWCSSPFIQRPHGSPKKFCSKKCKKKHENEEGKKARHGKPLPKINCFACGADIPQKLGRKKIYCSPKCKGKIASQKQNQKLRERKKKTVKKCIVCGENVKSPQIKYCSPKCRWQYWYKKEFGKGRYVYTCQYCHEEFRSFDDSRVYCSKECSGLAQRLIHAPKYPGKMKGDAVRESEVIRGNSVRFESCRLFREGYSVKAIAQALNVDNIKVQKWCQKIQSLNSTTSAYEWYETFKLKMAELTGQRKVSGEIIHLICARIDVRYNAHQLGEMLSEGLGADPFNGEKYAFCSKGNTIITVIQFDGKSLVSNTRHRTRGQ